MSRKDLSPRSLSFCRRHQQVHNPNKRRAKCRASVAFDRPDCH
jgi:hypothetical protein